MLRGGHWALLVMLDRASGSMAAAFLRGPRATSQYPFHSLCSRLDHCPACPTRASLRAVTLTKGMILLENSRRHIYDRSDQGSCQDFLPSQAFVQVLQTALDRTDPKSASLATSCGQGGTIATASPQI